MEIDGASNNGVDAVRDLRDTVSYLPSFGFYKIYIIDEVHMLSTSAFNAPFKNFGRASGSCGFYHGHNGGKQNSSNGLSRCQRLDFHLISPSIS